MKKSTFNSFIVISLLLTLGSNRISASEEGKLEEGGVVQNPSSSMSLVPLPGTLRESVAPSSSDLSHIPPNHAGSETKGYNGMDWRLRSAVFTVTYGVCKVFKTWLGDGRPAIGQTLDQLGDTPCAALAYGVSEFSKKWGSSEDLPTLNLHLAKLTGRVDGLENRARVAEELKGKLNRRVDGLDGRVKELDKCARMSEELKGKLNGRVDELDGRMKELDKRARVAEESESKLNGRVDGLDGRVKGLDERVGLVGHNIRDVSGHVSKLENLLADRAVHDDSIIRINSVRYASLGDQVLDIPYSRSQPDSNPYKSAYDAVYARCDSDGNCIFDVTNKFLRGDTVPGYPKILTVNYDCVSGKNAWRHVRYFPEGSQAFLQCSRFRKSH